MLTTEKKTGYAQHYIFIHYISIWNAEIGTQGQMKFYREPIEFLTDVVGEKDSDELTIVTYPHTHQNIFNIAQEREEEIRAVYNEQRKLFPTRLAFTIDIGETVRAITSADFKGYSPSSPAQDELFIYDVDVISGGFPQIHFYQKGQRNGVYARVFENLALSSSDIMYAQNPTKEGKRFVYNLLNSHMNRDWSEEFPPITSVDFPTNGKKEIPSFLNTEKLMEFLDTCHVDKVKVVNGEIVYEKEPEKKPEPSPVEKMAEDLFGKPDTQSLMLRIQKEASDKREVALSDIFQLGLEKTLVLLPFQDTPINVFLDVNGLVRKMCIFEGQFHLVPLADNEQSVEDAMGWLGESEEILHFCKEEDYPAKTPLLPAPKTDLIQ